MRSAAAAVLTVVSLQVGGTKVPLSAGQQDRLAQGLRALYQTCSLSSAGSPELFQKEPPDTAWERVRAGDHLYARFAKPLVVKTWPGKKVLVTEVTLPLGKEAGELGRHEGVATAFGKCSGLHWLRVLCADPVRPHLQSDRERECQLLDRK